jgi:hypothetical protein
MNIYRLLADLVVTVHFAYVAFVVVGLAVILLGGWRKWQWGRNFYFRLLHFTMIAVVVCEQLSGIICPLTEWEKSLRKMAGEPIEQGAFIERMLHHLVFLHIPQSAMTPFYCVFGLIVVATLFLVPPKWPGRKKGEGGRGKAE